MHPDDTPSVATVDTKTTNDDNQDNNHTDTSEQPPYIKNGEASDENDDDDLLLKMNEEALLELERQEINGADSSAVFVVDVNSIGDACNQSPPNDHPYLGASHSDEVTSPTEITVTVNGRLDGKDVKLPFDEKVTGDYGTPQNSLSINELEPKESHSTEAVYTSKIPHAPEPPPCPVVSSYPAQPSDYYPGQVPRIQSAVHGHGHDFERPYDPRISQVVPPPTHSQHQMFNGHGMHNMHSSFNVPQSQNMGYSPHGYPSHGVHGYGGYMDMRGGNQAIQHMPQIPHPSGQTMHHSQMQNHVFTTLQPPHSMQYSAQPVSQSVNSSPVTIHEDPNNPNRPLRITIKAPYSHTHVSQSGELCSSYIRSGTCKHGDKCRHSHDPRCLSLCRSYLAHGYCGGPNAAATSRAFVGGIDPNCPYAHARERDWHRTPDCQRFLVEKCADANCPYIHSGKVLLDETKECVCFTSLGFCPFGYECRDLHCRKPTKSSRDKDSGIKRQRILQEMDPEERTRTLRKEIEAWKDGGDLKLFK